MQFKIQIYNNVNKTWIICVTPDINLRKTTFLGLILMSQADIDVSV